jgi:hypothetical protein
MAANFDQARAIETLRNGRPFRFPQEKLTCGQVGETAIPSFLSARTRRPGSRTRCGGVTRGSNDRQARSGVPPWLMPGAS